MEVAAVTRKGEIRWVIGAAVLSRDDVLDVEAGSGKGRLRQKAVLAMPSRSLADRVSSQVG